MCNVIVFNAQEKLIFIWNHEAKMNKQDNLFASKTINKNKYAVFGHFLNKLKSSNQVSSFESSTSSS